METVHTKAHTRAHPPRRFLSTMLGEMRNNRLSSAHLVAVVLRRDVAASRAQVDDRLIHATVAERHLQKRSAEKKVLSPVFCAMIQVDE